MSDPHHLLNAAATRKWSQIPVAYRSASCCSRELHPVDEVVAPRVLEHGSLREWPDVLAFVHELNSASGLKAASCANVVGNVIVSCMGMTSITAYTWWRCLEREMMSRHDY